jgi:hypothetical protein
MDYIKSVAMNRVPILGSSVSWMWSLSGNVRAFTLVSGAAGHRPGVYAGSAKIHEPAYSPLPTMSAAFTRLLPVGDTSSRSRVNAADNQDHEARWSSRPRQPGVNAGPITAFGGKGRERPYLDFYALRGTPHEPI